MEWSLHAGIELCNVHGAQDRAMAMEEAMSGNFKVRRSCGLMISGTLPQNLSIYPIVVKVP
jgi:hypothetical protein